ncbi:MAG: hypothetical protein K6F61_05070 [Clostridiales bacterium]|nr:hypothetical protein [Clostridiales bacterium]
MATKSKAAAAKDAEMQEETVAAAEIPAEEPAAPVSEWDEEISMIVPRKPKGEDNFYYVCVNDRRFQIPANGEIQTLPKPIALVLADSLKAEAAADDFADHIPNKSV